MKKTSEFYRNPENNCHGKFSGKTTICQTAVLKRHAEMFAWQRWILAFFMMLLLVFWGSLRVFAAGGLSMSTDYPGIAVQAGDTQTISIDFSNTSGSGADVSLQVQELPDGWEGYFTGGSAQISRVYVKPGDNEGAASFHYTVPADTVEGSYQIVLNAASDNGLSAVLTLDLNVSETNVGASEFTTEYPEQEGSNGTSFSFSTTIVNNGADTQSYSFSTDAPSGWQVVIKPSGETTQIASIDVDAGSSQGLSVSVTPPNNVEAGSYPISISAISANETLKTELNVKITGSYELGLTTPSGLLSADAYANKETAVTLKVSNNGNVDLQNITLSSTAPDGWNVRFDQSSIDVLAAGSTQEITAYFTPSEQAMTGDYVVSISADTAETSQSLDFRVSVKTETIWGIAGILIIAVVIGALGFVFHKYGRR